VLIIASSLILSWLLVGSDGPKIFIKSGRTESSIKILSKVSLIFLLK
jgi:hypothetical protein